MKIETDAPDVCRDCGKAIDVEETNVIVKSKGTTYMLCVPCFHAREGVRK